MGAFLACVHSVALKIQFDFCLFHSKDTHFVLELIQNADDNDYPGLTGASFDVSEGSQAPAVLFKVQRHQITVYNNETGFQVCEVHIRMICNNP